MYFKSKILFCFLVLLFFTTRSIAQVVGDYQSNAITMNWNSTTQWQTWNGSAWQTTSIPPTAITSGQTVTILTGHTVTNNITTLTNSGNIIIDGTLTNAGTPLTNNSGGIITANGTLTNNASKTITNGGTIINNGVFTSSGVVNNNGTINIINGKTFTNAGSVGNNGTINNSGVLAQNNVFSNAAPGTINNSGSITVASAKTLTNNGIINNNLTITCTGKLTNNSAINISNTGTLTLIAAANTNSGTITNQGSFILNATTTTTFTNTGTIINSGTITNNSTSTSAFLNNTPGVIVNSGIITSGGALYFKFNAGSTYRHNFSSSASAIGKIPIATWAATSTCEIIAYGNGTVLPTSTEFANQTLGNFIWNNTTQANNINLNGRLLTIAGDLTVQNTNGFNLILRNTTGNSTTVNGSLNIPATGKLNLTSGSGTIGTSNHLLIVRGNFNLTGGSFDLTSNLIVGGNGNGTLNVAGNFIHSSGTLSKTGVTSGTININGTNAQAIESIGFTSGNTINFNITPSGINGITSILSGTSFVLNPGTILTVTDNTSSATDFNINGTFTANTNTWNMTSGLTSINGTFVNNVTSLIQDNSTPSNLTCASGGTFKLAADGGQAASALWNSNGILEVTGIVNSDSAGNCNQVFGKILWNSSGQLSSASFLVSNPSTPVFSTQNDFIVSSTGTGTLRFPDVDFTIGNNLIVQNASQLQVSNGPGLYTPASRNITITGDVNVLGSSSISIGKPNTSAASLSNISRDYIFLLKKNYSYTSSTPIISFDQRTFGGTLNNESYHLVFNFCGSVNQIFSSVAGGNLTAGSLTNEFISNSPYDIIISNNSTVTGSSDIKYHSLLVDAGSMLDMSAGTYNLIQYPALTIANVSDASSTVITGILNFGLGALSDATSTPGSFTLTNVSSAELRTKHSNGIALAGAASGCILCTNRNYGIAANYTYNGNSAQITGSGLPTAPTGILKIDNTTALSSGGVTLTQLTTITSATGVLELSAGKLITTASNLIVIGNTATVSPAGGQSTSFVEGPVKKTGLTTSEFQFPTGKAGKWARIGVTATASSTTNAFTAEYFLSDPTVISTALNNTVTGRELNLISTLEYWQLSQSSGSPSAKVKLYWEDGNYSGISNLADLRLAHYYNIGGAGLKWYGETNVLPVISGSIITGTIETASAISSFSPFTFGSSAGLNPLPIELLSFNGEAEKYGNQLRWSTATEINNDHFDLQRSEDGNQFNTIGRIEGQGNSSTTNNYSYLDEDPLNGINYYRLKQVDHNGDQTYSAIVAIESKAQDNSFVNVYPNPAVDNINISTSDDISKVQVFNALGEIVYESNVLNSSGTIELNTVSKGIYVIRATFSNDKVITSRFTKK